MVFEGLDFLAIGFLTFIGNYKVGGNGVDWVSLGWERARKGRSCRDGAGCSVGAWGRSVRGQGEG